MKGELVDGKKKQRKEKISGKKEHSPPLDKRLRILRIHTSNFNPEENLFSSRFFFSCYPSPQ